MESLIIAVLWLILYAVIVAAIIYGVIYVFEYLGFNPPAKVIQLVWLAFAIFVLILIVQLLLGSSDGHLLGIITPTYLSGFLP